MPVSVSAQAKFVALKAIGATKKSHAARPRCQA